MGSRIPLLELEVSGLRPKSDPGSERQINTLKRIVQGLGGRVTKISHQRRKTLVMINTDLWNAPEELRKIGERYAQIGLKTKLARKFKLHLD
ncbi:MAG: hypothetical protein QW343_00275 [Candidatus Norongarragalinales archaeon]